MFKIDEYIMCARNGVCRVMGIVIPDIRRDNNTSQYYKLQPIYDNKSTVYIPVNSDKIIMRELISKENAKDLINNINLIEELSFADDKIREQRYKEIIHTYKCKEIIKIVKTLYSRKKKNSVEKSRNTTIDNKYLKVAEDYLLGELSISLNISREEVENYIVESMKKYA
ncbi:CarD family transcriptional regulator [Clostridium saccharoperbutylacetonicum]|uniref:CarD family transcriptional regulator n=1 Tax=Clostridium saccharoperbutylacetonicum TaxID=36745 RepID=UPI0039EA7B19